MLAEAGVDDTMGVDADCDCNEAWDCDELMDMAGAFPELVVCVVEPDAAVVLFCAAATAEYRTGKGGLR